MAGHLVQQSAACQLALDLDSPLPRQVYNTAVPDRTLGMGSLSLRPTWPALQEQCMTSTSCWRCGLAGLPSP